MSSSSPCVSYPRSFWKHMSCTANEGLVRIRYKCLVPIYVFPEGKLCSLVTSKTEFWCSVSQFLHTYICERFIYFQDRSVFFAPAKYVDWSWEYINRSQTHKFRNWDWGRTISFQEIHKLNFLFRYSVVDLNPHRKEERRKGRQSTQDYSWSIWSSPDKFSEGGGEVNKNVVLCPVYEPFKIILWAYHPQDAESALLTHHATVRKRGASVLT